MANFLESLLVRLEADVRGFREALYGAETATQKYEKNVNRFLSRSERRFSSWNKAVSAQLRNVTTALAAGLSFQAIEGALSDAIEFERALRGLADATGISAAELQQLALVFQQFGLNEQQAAGAVADFARNTAELRTHSGGFFEFLRTAMPDLIAQLENTRDLSQATDVLADAVRHLAEPTDRALLLTRALGNAGRDLVGAFKDGAGGLAEAKSRVEELNVVLSEEQLAALQRAGKAWDEWQARVVASVRRTVADAVPLLERLQAAQQQNLRTLQERFGVRPPAASAPPELPPWETTVTPAPAATLRLGQRRDTSGTDSLLNLQRELAQLQGRQFEVIRMEQQRELENFQQILADKKISEEQYLQARALVNQIASEKIAAELRREIEPFTQIIGNALSEPLRDAFQGNLQSMEHYFQRLLANLAEATVQLLVIKPLMASLTNTLVPGIGSLFGGFGGFFANGGPVVPNKPVVVGERGPELYVPALGGQIIPNHRLGAGGTTVVNNYAIDARNAEIGVEERIASALIAVERQRVKPVDDMLRYRTRFPNRGV